MAEIYFIGGASGSGKSAIINDLKKILGDSINVYDFDEIGVPRDADTKWRQENTEKWLQRIISEDKNACLLGQIVLGEILACPSAKKLKLPIEYCLLEVSNEKRIERLTKGNIDYLSSAQNMLNWASWLTKHHKNPQHEQGTLKENSWDGLDFSNWDKLDNWDGKANVEFLDTTELSIEDVASLIIKHCKEKIK